MDIKEFCDRNVQLSIYGCGMYGRLLLENLDRRGIEVSSFVVSDSEDVSQMGGDKIPIYRLSEWKACNEGKKHGILVAVSEMYMNEILSNLEQNDIHNYFAIRKADWDIAHIGLMDTTINTLNNGNGIIMQAVYEYLLQVYGNAYIHRLSFYDDYEKYALQNIERCESVFVGGTNALNSEMDIIRDIGVNDKNIDILKNKIVLFGVGWRVYEKEPNEYTKKLICEMLNNNVIHSVRDGYAERMLRRIGIENVVNTGCPTLWKLTKEHCAQIPKEKSENVVVMMTPKDMKKDSFIMEIIRKNYKNIYFWPQGADDYWYIKTLCPKAIMISPQLEELDKFLELHQDIDYVGTRLHGGIKCLQHKKRTIIIALDNRAIEMKKDFNLPVVLPDEVGRLDEFINRKSEIDICLPQDNIDFWLSQFTGNKNKIV